MGAPSRAKCPTCGQVRPLLSVSDAAYAVGVTRKTIYRWIDSGILVPIVLPSGLLRILPESLMRILSPEASAAREASGGKNDPARKKRAIRNPRKRSTAVKAGNGS